MAQGADVGALGAPDPQQEPVRPRLFQHLQGVDGDGPMVRNGSPVPVPGLKPGQYRVYSREKEFLCLSRYEDGALRSITGRRARR